jgi:cytoskeletal protein CcmA (bactofilin family)
MPVGSKFTKLRVYESSDGLGQYSEINHDNNVFNIYLDNPVAGAPVNKVMTASDGAGIDFYAHPVQTTGTGSFGNLVAQDGLTVSGTVTVSGDVTVHSNIGVGTNNPEAGVHVRLPTTNIPTVDGITMGMTGDGDDYANLKLCSSDSTAFSQIDFTTPTNKYEGRISYDHTNSKFLVKTLLGSVTALELSNDDLIINGGFTVSGDVTASGNITTVGTITGNNLISSDGLTVSGNVTASGNITTDGTITGSDLIIDTNTLFVDGTNNKIGISTTTPLQTLHNTGKTVFGNEFIQSRQTFTDGTRREYMSECSSEGGSINNYMMYWQQSDSSGNNPVKTNVLSINTNQIEIPGDLITPGTVDCGDLTTSGGLTVSGTMTISGDITTTGKFMGGGMLTTIVCESSESMVAATYPFSYGHSNQSSGVFGINLGEGTWKLLSYGFNSHDDPNNYTSTTRISLRINKNNTFINAWMYMDWSSGQANTGQNRYSDVPSSSASSQVDYQPEITASTSGDTISIYVDTATDCHANIVEHRLTMHWMRVDAPRIV